MEFLDVVKLLWSNNGPVTFKGKHFDIQDASIYPDHASTPFPKVYMGGSSEAGRHVGAMWAPSTPIST